MPMKAIVTDYGDPSVGIFMQSFEIDCPFDETIDAESREFFRDKLKDLYKEFCDCKIDISFSDERDIE